VCECECECECECVHYRGVRVGLGVVELDAGEDGVIEAHVHRHDGEVDRVGLVRLQRRRDGQVRACVAVEDIHLAPRRRGGGMRWSEM
jgi:hypothetical protein